MSKRSSRDYKAEHSDLEALPVWAIEALVVTAVGFEARNECPGCLGCELSHDAAGEAWKLLPRSIKRDTVRLCFEMGVDPSDVFNLPPHAFVGVK